MSKSNRIRWINGVLDAKHMEGVTRDMEHYTWNLIHYTQEDHFGIIDIEFDKIALKNFVLSVRKLKCIFADGTFVNFHNEYPMEISLQEYRQGFHDKKVFFLNISNNLLKSVEEHDNGFAIVAVTKSEQKILINDNVNKNSLCCTALSFHRGQLVLDNSCQILMHIPRDHEIMNRLQTLYDKVHNRLLFMASQLELQQKIEGILELFRSLNKVCGYILQAMGHHHPRKIYEKILSALGEISWSKQQVIPQLLYEHSKAIKILEQLIEYLDNSIDNSTTIKSFKFIKIDNYLRISLMPKIKIKKLYITLLPNNDSVVHWIYNTQIASFDQIERVGLNRIIGINRKTISNGSHNIILELDINSEYFTGQSIAINTLSMAEEVSCFLTIVEEQSIKKNQKSKLII